MPEPDQTKWRGIRPTNPPENIPVTESVPLTDILVAPSAGDPQFQTLTKKRAPAIGDLQAVKERLGSDKAWDNRDCTVRDSVSADIVTAGEIWVITTVSAVNLTTICDISIQAWLDAGWQVLKSFYSVEPNLEVSWDGKVVLKNPDYIRAYFYLGGALDSLEINVTGYKIGIY